MNQFVISAILFEAPSAPLTFEAPGDADALWFSRGFVAAQCELRPEFEIGKRYRVDRLVVKDGTQVVDDTTFAAECEVVERDGQVGAIWRVPAPPPKASKH
ncbi:hypothetical protein [Brevundimonas sp. R86498]|uniref:hypothetical protein n=1 Tax=Brevundimonas sp. R86498 TaxID=3093845 RepID=UPI0037C79BD9